MPDDTTTQIEKLRQTLADLEARQRDLAGLADLSAAIADVKARLIALGDTSVGRTTKDEGRKLSEVAVQNVGVQLTESAVGGDAVGRDKNVTVIGTQIVQPRARPCPRPRRARPSNAISTISSTPTNICACKASAPATSR